MNIADFCLWYSMAYSLDTSRPKCVDTLRPKCFQILFYLCRRGELVSSKLFCSKVTQQIEFLELSRSHWLPKHKDWKTKLKEKFIYEPISEEFSNKFYKWDTHQIALIICK